VVAQLLAMHQGAYRVLKADAKRRGRDNQVGIDQHVRTFVPWSNEALLDRVTAWMINRKFVWEHLNDTAANSDYVGINYYGRYYVKATGMGKFQTFPRDDQEQTAELSEMGWESDHDGLAQALSEAARRYRKPIYVLENGFADSATNDVRRERFILGQTQAVWRAIEAGADVRSFMYWALTDNFEWAEGFAPRFGLVEIDYDNDFARKPRRSAELYARLARTNAISADDWSATE
jgi:beta-glucosidase